jgi:site-specific recombinase
MKLLRRWKKRREVRELQLRIDHCRSTIAQVHKALLLDDVQPEIAQQFRRLESALEQVDVTQLNDRDLKKIETATNKLLAEFRSLYRKGKLRNIHDGLVH